MRVKIREHISTYEKNYDRYRILESSSVTKNFIKGKCWIVVDQMAFETENQEADAAIKEVFQTGMLDLSHLIPFDLQSVLR